ncbi:hypothetical protein F511_41770 [Dorcoceras hygrometricum]|uniref:Cholesterol oxidase n=1 Tax=Dorcoceras hygrometricum TaxID=472368 RepID=A0A2Z7C7I3_9LAMI|nr:hypothetical protein F511_41770 [Dorcoceras hygrometricum]
MDKSNYQDFLNNGNDQEYDAVVIGSGYGGSVAACRLSKAGFKVGLMEKGRRWDARDFPTDIFKISSLVRVENSNLGLNFGPKDALFQVHQQEDSFAAMGCGLGGGSLVNAGVMMPTPVRARRDVKWPKDWEKDWEIYEALASDMLSIQKLPLKFQNAKIMEDAVDEDYDTNTGSPIKLSVNFNDIEGKNQQSGSCLACGNCLSGCPYNAKNSTDKNYLHSAIQAGCTIKTECEVQYVVRNRYEDYEEGSFKTGSRRRWLVFFNEIDYVASDIVIISAGVFGTAKILFQSQMRGLSVSQKLGFGLSCNGNNVAYLVRSSARLNSSGLGKQQFSRIPFRERPGPSISSSYTSSLGITIQSAVIPAAYPRFVIKGFMYKWQSEGWFLREVIESIKHLMGSKHRQEMVLNAMGYDDSNGKLTFDQNTSQICFQPPHDALLPRKIEAFQKVAKKLGGTLFISQYRSTSVHHLGGCIASSDVSSGVCNSAGQVFDNTSQTGVHTGLYICDASMIPSSVGINPSLTIAAAAEHVSRRLIQNAYEWIGRREFDTKQGSISNSKMTGCGQEVMVQETLRGQVGGMQCTAYLKMRFENFPRNHDNNGMVAGESHPLLRGRVGGHVVCKAIEIDEMYIIRGEVDLCKTDIRTPYTQFMHYNLLLATSSGSRYILEGRKIMNPYLLALYAWRESTTLNVTLRKITNDDPEREMTNLQGKLHISLFGLLKSIWSLEGGSKISFIFIFLQSLLRTYILQEPRGRHLDFVSKDLETDRYPDSTVHEIKTYDGLIISCQQWESSKSTGARKHEKTPYPVLLINGYSTESYSLPTEPNDLVRTILKEGHDVWLLRTRVHPSYSLNSFSIDDIGRFDIAAAVDKIIQLYGESAKVHIVGHCVGGVAIHIALMGGHVSTKKIASLSCTNSSMFFKLTTSSLVKMWLPLTPISMAILGENKVLPLLAKTTTSFRHDLLKSIARLIPRCERCTCDECEVFSGIFGNAFWHENVSHTMHNWLNKINVPRLPMAGFTHLRKICNAGFILDSNGNNTYMVHPERMALPTLYISGGRTLLVTPETSLLANKYMKLHQQSYRHERVVVDGFGHSDLLIGEKSFEKVFPHIITHISLAEKGTNMSVDSRDNRYKKEVVGWSNDVHEDGGSFGFWVFCLIVVVLVVMFKSFSFS